MMGDWTKHKTVNSQRRSAFTKCMVGVINNTAARILAVDQKIAKIPGKTPEIIATILYAVMHLVMAVFHEPWYDEAVAWQIARCASVKKIILEIPHYEGHPSLWHLILIPFAKTGAPYEVSMTFISLVFAGAAVGLIIWRSPFPRLMRLLLPFTYFLFYQYGVISRPYCIMMLAIVLLAITWKKRNEAPLLYVLCLALLCLTSAYGIVIAGGMSIVWVLEILKEKRTKIKELLTDHRVFCLAGLFVLAVLLIVQIMPRSDTYATQITKMLKGSRPVSGTAVRVFYMLISSLPDTLLTDTFCSQDNIKMTNFDTVDLVASTVCGIVLLTVIYRYGRRKKTAAWFFVPYVLFAGFASMVYVYPHHVGILYLYVLFWCWISVGEKEVRKEEKSTETRPPETIRSVVVWLTVLAVGVPLVWTIGACVQDICYEYAPGRNEAAFIKEHHLDQYRIMAQWQIGYKWTDDGEKKFLFSNSRQGIATDNIAPYFAHNLFYNMMGGKDSLNYTTHKVLPEEQEQKELEKWEKEPAPDVLYMNPQLDRVWKDGAVSQSDYSLVYERKAHKIWKMFNEESIVRIYVRKDLAKKLGLKERKEKYYF